MSDDADIAQRTEEWLQARMGHATASMFCDILAIGRDGKPTKARQDAIMEKVAERLYGVPHEGPTGRALQWGTEAEPYAVEAYEQAKGVIVMPSPFIKHKAIPWCGASPDGLVGRDGCIEVKSPKDTKVQLATWLTGMPLNHKPQVQGVMWIAEREWCDFISYDPRPVTKPELRLYVQRVYRDDQYIKTVLEPGVKAFLAEVNTMGRRVLAALKKSQSKETV